VRVAILGAGKIGESLLAGLSGSDWADIVASTRREERAAELREHYGVEATTSNPEAIKNADVVVLAVKPQDLATLLGEISHLIQPVQTVLSVAAAISTVSIERHLAADVPVVRSMPNAPSTVHEGIAGVCPGRHAGREHVFG
jgi:pyrroline-5-carboxylate reductase